MLDEEQAFFRAMEAAPDDDLSRLVYADWLDDRGDADRAAFVRLQIAEWQQRSASPDRRPADELLRKHHKTWTAGLPPWVATGDLKYTFVRGFPVLPVMSGQQFLADAAALRERMPLAEVWFRSLGRTAPRVFACEHFAAIRRVGLFDCRLRDADIAALAASEHARQLTHVGLRRFPGHTRLANRLTDAAAVALAGSPNLPSLASLDLSHYGTITAAGFRAILHSRRLPGLRRLVLGGDGGPELGRAFASRKFRLDQLRTLDLSDCRLGDAGAAALAKSPHLANLVSLDLGGNDLTDAGAVAVVASPFLRTVRELTLDGNPRLTDATAEAVLADGRDWAFVKVDSFRTSVPMTQAIRFKLGPASPQEMR